jgi:membrane-bound lytic murein transglycosylase D
MAEKIAIFDTCRLNTRPMLPRIHTLAGGVLVLLSLTGCASLTEPYLPSPAKRPVLAPAKPAPPAPANRSERKPPTVASTANGTPAPSKLIRLPSADIPADQLRSASRTLLPGSAQTDLMERIRSGFTLPEHRQSAIDVQLAWFKRNPAYLDRVFGRAALYMHHIAEEVERRGIPMEIALLPVIESAFEPFAYSSARASGLWQFIPDTGSRFGLPQNWWYDGRRDVVEATRAALDYLQFMHGEFQGDWLLAVAGYNCGERCVSRAVARNKAEGKPTTFWDLRLPKETEAYVPKLLAMKRLVADPAALGLEFSPIPNEPYFTKVEVGQQIDLKLAADLAGLTHDELFELNPAFHRWATPPQGPHALLLPIDTAELFKQNLAQLTPDELMRVTHHVVKDGETLAELATRYGTNVTTIRMLNGLESNTLRAGLDLRVPSGSTQLPEKVLRAAARVDGPQPPPASRRARPEVHVVRRGESIWSIAQRNNMSPQALMRLNGKSAQDKIMPGERLILAQNPANLSSHGASAEGPRLTHRVSSGETLSAIARRYGVSISQLTAWNGISVDSTLKVGQRLTIRTRRR